MIPHNAYIYLSLVVYAMYPFQEKKGYFHIFPRKHFLYYKRKSFDQLLNTKYIGTFTFPVLVKKLFPSVYPHTWTQTYTLTNTSLLIYNGSFKLRYAYNHISIFWRISKTFLQGNRNAQENMSLSLNTFRIFPCLLFKFTVIVRSTLNSKLMGQNWKQKNMM